MENGQSDIHSNCIDPIVITVMTWLPVAEHEDDRCQYTMYQIIYIC